MLKAPPSAAHMAAFERLKHLERLLDRQFSIGGFQFGVDSIIGLVPVVGDLISGALGLYLIAEAKRIGVSRWTLVRMYANWGVDVTIGAVPVVGDLFDLAFKSNTKNVKMLVAELEKWRGKSGPRIDPDIIEHAPLDQGGARTRDIKLSNRAPLR